MEGRHPPAKGGSRNGAGGVYAAGENGRGVLARSLWQSRAQIPQGRTIRVPGSVGPEVLRDTGSRQAREAGKFRSSAEAAHRELEESCGENIALSRSFVTLAWRAEPAIREAHAREITVGPSFDTFCEGPSCAVLSYEGLGSESMAGETPCGSWLHPLIHLMLCTASSTTGRSWNGILCAAALRSGRITLAWGCPLGSSPHEFRCAPRSVARAKTGPLASVLWDSADLI